MITIVKNGSTRYNITNFKRLHIGLNQNVSSYEIPEAGWRIAHLIKVMGNILSINVSWEMTHGDKGTGAGDMTPFQQVLFFITEYELTSFSDRYELIIVDSEGFNFRFVGLPPRITFDTSDDNVLTFTANMEFIAGDTIASIEDTDDDS